MEYEEGAYNELWRTLPAGVEPPAAPPTPDPDDEFEPGLPEENLLYFLEKTSPSLKPWQRETLRIVRNLAQYFYPQRQLKVMNEGCATFVHYQIMNTLYDRGQIDEGAWLEFVHSHTSVVFQPEFADKRYYGINPYALGYAMMDDIKRICERPTEEDRDWFPDLAGSGDAMAALRYAWATYRVGAIHNERGYREVRRNLARQYDTSGDPNIQVAGANLKGNRTLVLEHRMNRGVPLHNTAKEMVLAHVEFLWGHDVRLEEVAG
jgi:spore cortex formation protein SpoVR/YcgB (stage V sporulation)